MGYRFKITFKITYEALGQLDARLGKSKNSGHYCGMCDEMEFNRFEWKFHVIPTFLAMVGGIAIMHGEKIYKAE